MPFPFEVSFEEVKTDLNTYVDEIFGALHSEFLTLPRGDGFVKYTVFEKGYEALKHATNGFRSLEPEPVIETIQRVPIAFVVLRTMLGFTPPEWAYIATSKGSTEVSQNAIRSLDRKIRMAPLTPLPNNNNATSQRLRTLVDTACQLLIDGAPHQAGSLIHRLDKADTRDGLDSLSSLANLGVPYATLLYERLLGRPFSGHRDSVSELIGDVLEGAIEKIMTEAGIEFRKTKRAERITGFDQNPDFIIPDEFNPQIVIEAKIAEDDGTARDKVTRIQHLEQISRKRGSDGLPQFEVIAFISGRGFKNRSEDMKKLILSTRGKVFTLQNLDQLVDCTRLSEFRTPKRS